MFRFHSVAKSKSAELNTNTEDFLHHLTENTNLQKRILHPSVHLRFIQVTILF